MKILLTHPGTQYAPMLAAQLQRKGILYRYVSGINFSNQQTLFWKLLRLSGLEKLAKRRILNIPADKLYRIAWPDLWSLYRMRAGHQRDILFYECNGWFQKLLPQKLLQEADVVIGFDTSSWILAERCKAIKKPYVIDISIGHPVYKEQVFEQLRRRYPAWQNELKPKRKENLDVELLEMQLADHFVAATEFTRKTYVANGITAEKISINPYGTDLAFFQPKVFNQVTIPPITFLYFSKISARKGFPWLCEVWASFHAQYPDTRLIAAGYGKAPEGFVVPRGVEMAGFVHPNDRVKLFHSADVFVFPSFFEGFGQVIIEAMACGLPVITTTHTVGPEIIDSGKEGFVITPGADTSLYKAMEHFVIHNDQLAVMGKAARDKVLPMSWDAYGDRWNTICKSVISNL